MDVVTARPDELLSAALRALATFDLDLADSLATAARHLRGGWWADQVMAEVLVRKGRYPQAARVLPHRPPTNAAPEERTRWAVVSAAIRYWGAGDVAGAERVLAEVGGPVTEAHRAGFVLLDGRLGPAWTMAEAVLRDRRAPAEAAVPAVATAVVAASLLGRFDRANWAVDRAGPAARSIPQLRYVHCFAVLMSGRVREAARLADEGYRDARAGGNTAVSGGWSALRGLVATARGDLTSAVGVLTAATALLDGHDSCRLLAPALAELARAHAMAGDVAAATRTLRLAAARTPKDRLFAPWFALSQAWAVAAGGDTSLAVRQASAAADHARATGQFALEAVARYDLARLGGAKAAHRRLGELTTLVQGPLVPVMAGAAAALAAGDAEALARAAAAFTALGMDLHAAETATVAAALYRGTGRAVLADQVAARAPAGQNAATPLLRHVTELVELTRRERDVALLAVAGLTSQRIGVRLRLSVRTVDNYLGRIYQKLGVVSRKELAVLVRCRLR